MHLKSSLDIVLSAHTWSPMPPSAVPAEASDFHPNDIATSTSNATAAPPHCKGKAQQSTCNHAPQLRSHGYLCSFVHWQEYQSTPPRKFPCVSTSMQHLVAMPLLYRFLHSCCPQEAVLPCILWIDSRCQAFSQFCSYLASQRLQYWSPVFSCTAGVNIFGALKIDSLAFPTFWIFFTRSNKYFD